MTDREDRQRHHRGTPSDAQRDERVKIDMDPEDALRVLLGVKPGADEPDEAENPD